MKSNPIKTPERIEPHQWTNGTDYVLICKCLNSEGEGYNHFKWPKMGPVENDRWSRDATCDSGGLFGWPWGFSIGDGKAPNACHRWLVFRAKPSNVIGQIEGEKCKAVPGKDGELPEVVYYGTQAGAMKVTHDGRMALIVRNSAATSGYSSSAATSGESSSAATSGDRSTASATGEYSTLDVAKHSIGSCTANRFTWVVRKGAVLLAQWSKDNKTFHTKLFDSEKLKVADGAKVKIQFGKIFEKFSDE